MSGKFNKKLAALLLLTPVLAVIMDEKAFAQQSPAATQPFICNDKTDAGAAIEANRLMMNRFVEFINTDSKKMAGELVSPYAIFFVPGRAEPVKGPPGYLAIIDMMRSGFPDIQWTLEETVVEPNKVAARFTMRGTHQGAFFGIPPTGKTIAVQALNIYHLCGGQIVGEFGQPDLLGLMQQIGAVAK
jgi:predicted ester cyclase